MAFFLKKSQNYKQNWRLRMKKVVLTVLVKNKSNPSSRYRILQYLPLFQEKGWDVRVYDLNCGVLSKAAAYFKAVRDSDVIFVQRKLLQPWESALLSKKPLVFDMDDAVVYHDSTSGSGLSKSRESKFRSTAGRAACVVAGSAILQNMAKEYGARDTVVIPTSVDTDIYAPKYVDKADAVTIGWIGSRSTLWYLDAIKPAVSRLLKRHENLSMLVVADKPYDFGSSRSRFEPWSEEKEAALVASFDIGLMPLSDDPWSRGKCGFKIVQYCACAVPSVCSPVGANLELIEDGAEGFFAADLAQWEDRLELLVTDASLREAMGSRARNRAVKDYSMKTNFSKLLEAVEAAAAR